MKIYIKALLIAITSSVLVNSLTKRDDCASQINEIKDTCVIKEVTKDNYKKVCENLKSEKCQKFFIDPFSVAKACLDNPDALEEVFDENTMNNLRRTFSLSCSTDGNGKECPVTSVFVNKSTDYNNLVKNSCSSKTCSDALNEYIDSILADGPNETLENMKKELNGDDCVKLNKDDSTSSASSVILTAKFGSSLLLALLLSYALF